MNTEALHDRGYTVLSHFLSAAELFTSVSDYVAAHRMDPIFNYNIEATSSDRKRRQIDMPAALCRRLRERLTEAVGYGAADSRTATDFVILESLRGCQRQAAHVDYVPDDALLETTDDTVPLLAVVALQDGTMLDVWPGSHRLVRRRRLTRHTPHVRREIVELDAGDVIVFRGDLIHAGSAYTSHNLRLHAYIDHPLVPRPPNKTWVIQRHATELLRAAVDES